MVKTKEELLTAVSGLLGDLTTDAAIEFLEDLQDTITDLEEKVTVDDGEDWEARYEENDREWRERYTARFFNKEENDPLPDPEPEIIDEEPKTFEELFIEEE